MTMPARFPRDRSAVAGAIPVRAGIGLRLPHHRQALEGALDTSWLEVHPENYMADAAALEELLRIRRNYPLSLHAVGLSPGSAQGVDEAHLQRLAELVEMLQPALVSDHLAWNSAGGLFVPDLLPLPYTEEALEVVCRNVDRIQTVLRRRLLLENPSTYLQYAHSPIAEEDFLGEVVARTGCGVLLDVNNVYVSACNQGLIPELRLLALLTAIPEGSIGELHLAGHAITQLEDGAVLRIDDHGSVVSDAVWKLYAMALDYAGPIPTLIEWDRQLPDPSVLLAEAAKAQAVMDTTVPVTDESGWRATHAAAG